MKKEDKKILVKLFCLIAIIVFLFITTVMIVQGAVFSTKGYIGLGLLAIIAISLGLDAFSYFKNRKKQNNNK